MTFIRNASWLSTNSRSKRSIKISRFPGCNVYCLNSTTGQQSCEDRICFKLSPIGSVMPHLSIPSVEMKKAEVEGRLPIPNHSSPGIVEDLEAALAIGNRVASKLRKRSRAEHLTFAQARPLSGPIYVLYSVKYFAARDCTPGPNTLAAALLPSSFRNKDFASFFCCSDTSA